MVYVGTTTQQGTAQGDTVMTLTPLDNNAIIDARPSSEEMRDFARVLKAALMMVIRYLERRYRV